MKNEDRENYITSFRPASHFNFNKLLLISIYCFDVAGEKALIEFLQEEIEQEKGSLAGHLPSQLEHFQIKYEGADVELTKTIGSEK